MLRTFLATLLIAAAASAQTVPDTLFNGLKWRLIGPYRGGRSEAVTGIPGDPNTYFFGGVAGGVWKSTDGGGNWTPIFDKQPVASIGAIAVADSDPNVIYVGTGEGCIRGNLASGDGVYKSTDGGRSWKNVGLKDSRQIGALIVDPRNSNVVLVAALGHVYGPNAERGVFRTTDGGATWQKVLFKNDHTGAIDVVFDPKNPNIVFASLWEVSRTPWSLSSGGEGSGLYKSTDGGATWTRLDGHGLPKGPLGRIGVSVSGADDNRVYALIEAVEGGLFRSDDQGETWTKVNDDERYRQRAWYFTHIFADPKAADTVYVLNTGAFRSSPVIRTRTSSGGGGGVWKSTEGGRNWNRIADQNVIVTVVAPAGTSTPMR